MLTAEAVAVGVEQRYLVRGAQMQDIEAVAEMLNLGGIKVKGHPDIDVDEMRIEWTNPTWNRESSTRVVFNASGDPIGYVEVWDNTEMPTNIWTWGRVHPEYEGEGIGGYLMKWAEQRARQAIHRVPKEIRVALKAGADGENKEAQRLFEGYGMTQIRRFWKMRIELDKPVPEPQFPDGMVIRTYDEVDDLRKLYRAVNDGFKDHWGYVERPEEEQMVQWRHFLDSDPHYDPTLFFLAMDGDEIGGISLCRPVDEGDPTVGHCDQLAIRPPWRRKRVALNLLYHTFREFQRRGHKAVTLGVDATSLTGAEVLYQKAGMHREREGVSYELILRPGKDISTQEAGQHDGS